MRNIDEMLIYSGIEEINAETLKEQEKNNIYLKVQKKMKREGLQRNHFIKKSFIKASLIAACLMILAFTTAFAINHFGLDEKLAGFLNVTTTQQEKLNTGISNPTKSISNKGITVNVLQTLSDKRSIYVVYDVTFPNNIKLNDDYYFENMSIFPVDKETYTSVGNSCYILEQSNNTRKYVTILDADSNLKNGKIRLKIENLCNRSNKNNIEIVGIWEAEWEFDVDNVTRTKEIYPDITVKAFSRNIQKEKQVVVNNIIISPLSIAIEVSAPNAQSSADNHLVTWVDVKMKNGSTFTCGKNDVDKSFSADAKKGTLYYRLKNIIDIDEVDSISIGDKIIELD